MKAVVVILIIGLVPLVLWQMTKIFRPIPMSDLHKYVGQSRKVEVTIGRAYQTSKGEVILYVVESKDFRFILPASKITRFPKNPQLYYPGKRLRVTETLSQDEEGYFMELESKNQIGEVRQK